MTLTEVTDEERLVARLDRSDPKLKAIKKWLDQASVDVLPKPATGTAVAYRLSQWDQAQHIPTKSDH